MNRRYFTLATIAFIISLFLLALYGNIVAGSSKNARPADDIDKLEQAIIVNGLEMVSENPFEEPKEEEQNGTIIYDESFDDTIACVSPSGRDEGADKPSDSSRDDKDTMLAGLKSRDARWHLTKYRIQKGDNLWTIAKKFNTDHRLIVKANDIESPDMLASGNTIVVPNRNGINYTVKAGDTIKSISGAYGVTGKSVQEHNRISVAKVSSSIFIPDARRIERTVAGKTQTRAAAVAANPGILLSWPVVGGITSGFGNRIDPFTRRPQFHCGIDIYVPVDTPVVAAGPGTVIFSGWKDGYGNMVVVSHANGYITVYAHNKQNVVAAGTEVKAGQQLALSGMTGAVTGPHVHFELRKYLIPLNPLRFLR
jgi:murein DD-endopeptidase MepM/ murein hydrolase activator NlpD